MNGIVMTFQNLGVTENSLKEFGGFEYHLWYKNSEYSVLFEPFKEGLIEVSLLRYGRDENLDRHIYGRLEDVVAAFAMVENDIYFDHSLPFWKKPKTLWKKLESVIEKGGH